MKLPLLLLALTLLVGCDQAVHVRPHGRYAYQVEWQEEGTPWPRIEIFPCSQATTSEARFVCFGETETKGIHGYPNAGGGGNTTGAPKASTGVGGGSIIYVDENGVLTKGYVEILNSGSMPKCWGVEEQGYVDIEKCHEWLSNSKKIFKVKPKGVTSTVKP